MAGLYRLSWLDGKTSKVPVNWRAMETEELGLVYESLLELQPKLAEDGRTLNFAFETAEQKGNQRKTTSSYYTPDSLVQALLDTAVDPVLDRTEAEADDPAAALLKLSVIDPGCGSGHSLLAAARRIASRLARIRAEGTQWRISATPCVMSRAPASTASTATRWGCEDKHLDAACGTRAKEVVKV